MKSLAAICITKNEEKYLAKALESVKNFVDEIVVVDSESTDKTVEIANSFTDKVFTREWSGYGEQKNFAAGKTDCEWILQIDADEEVPLELAEEIKKILEQPEFNFYWLPIVTVFLGKPLHHLSGNNLRLFNRNFGRWDGKKVHEQVIRKINQTPIKFGDDDSRRLNNFLLHHSHYQTIEGYLERQENYSSADALEMQKTGLDRVGKKVNVDEKNPFSVVVFLFDRALKQFIKKFIKQKGYLDGYEGWLWCFFSAQYEYKMCRKYLALTKSAN